MKQEIKQKKKAFHQDSKKTEIGKSMSSYQALCRQGLGMAAGGPGAARSGQEGNREEAGRPGLRMPMPGKGRAAPRSGLVLCLVGTSAGLQPQRMNFFCSETELRHLVVNGTSPKPFFCFCFIKS
uniref:Uncharacterized protein n=1 Tax=Molossus molossus TaxID=27622 RepID=A0A7J8GKK0_MOLMO|nr:hypothetical protein HJG59_011503 [Molossus molossus]